MLWLRANIHMNHTNTGMKSLLTYVCSLRRFGSDWHKVEKGDLLLVNVIQELSRRSWTVGLYGHLAVGMWTIHRLKMELDLQSLFGLLCTAVLTETPQLPHSPSIWAHIRRALLGSQDRRHLFVTSLELSNKCADWRLILVSLPLPGSQGMGEGGTEELTFTSTWLLSIAVGLIV